MRQWRSTVMFGIAIFVATWTFAATAHASVAVDYQDWGTVAPSDASPLAQAWKWTGSTWRIYVPSLASSSRAYVYPFAEGWSWAWTENSGWVAVRSVDLDPGFGTCERRGADLNFWDRELNRSTIFVRRTCRDGHIVEYELVHYYEGENTETFIDWQGGLRNNRGCTGVARFDSDLARHVRRWTCPTAGGGTEQSTWQAQADGWRQVA